MVYDSKNYYQYQLIYSIILLMNLEKVLLSTLLNKYNHVNKRQTRVLVITNMNVYNITPGKKITNFFAKMMSSLRMKRKIPLSKIFGATVNRFGNEFIIHIPDEYDYRFSSDDFRDKIIETLCEAFCGFNKRKMAFFYKVNFLFLLIILMIYIYK